MPGPYEDLSADPSTGTDQQCSWITEEATTSLREELADGCDISHVALWPTVAAAYVSGIIDLDELREEKRDAAELLVGLLRGYADHGRLVSKELDGDLGLAGQQLFRLAERRRSSAGASFSTSRHGCGRGWKTIARA